MNDPQQLLTALPTEHFTLQGARSQTMSKPIFAFSSAIAVINGVIGGAIAAQPRRS